jgi:hypothetical protein
MTQRPDEKFDEKEAQARFEAALRGALKIPHDAVEGKTEAAS